MNKEIKIGIMGTKLKRHWSGESEVVSRAGESLHGQLEGAVAIEMRS